MKRTKKYFFVVFCCFFLIFVEIYSKIVFKKEHHLLILKYKERKSGIVIPSKNSRLVYTFRTNEFGTNSHGFFDYEHSDLKPENVFRIIIIGDSVAAGDFVGWRNSFGKILEKKINNLNHRKKIEVIILARTGYSTSQELVLLEKEAFNYSPDLIIWSYLLNDPAHPLFHNASGELGIYFYTPKIYTLYFISKKLFILREKLKSIGCSTEYHELLHHVYWTEVKKNIKKIGRVSRKKNIPIIFLIHPILEKGKAFSNYSLTELHRRLEKTAQEEGLFSLDILDKYFYYNCNNLSLKLKGQYDCWHPNKKGHEIIAKYIYHFLKNNKLMSKNVF